MKTLFLLFLLLSCPVLAQEQPGKDLLPAPCFAAAMKCWENDMFGVSVFNACGLSNNPIVARIDFQQSTNLLTNWQTFKSYTNVPLYGCTGTNYEPIKPNCFYRIVVYP